MGLFRGIGWGMEGGCICICVDGGGGGVADLVLYQCFWVDYLVYSRLVMILCACESERGMGQILTFCLDWR